MFYNYMNKTKKKTHRKLKKIKKKSFKKKGGSTVNNPQNNTQNNPQNNPQNNSQNKFKISYGGRPYELKCEICGNSNYVTRTTKIPTGSRMTEIFFGETAEIFENKAQLLTCITCGNILWFDNKIEVTDTNNPNQGKSEEKSSRCNIM